MLFYYLDGLDKKGPYTADELKTRNLPPETLVFTEGMDRWKSIKEIEILNSELFAQPTIDSELKVDQVKNPIIIDQEIQSAKNEKNENKIKIVSYLVSKEIKEQYFTWI